MGRILLIIFLPLLGPIIAYLGWLHLTGRRAFESGTDLEAVLKEGPSLWLMSACVALTVASLLLFTDFERSAPGGNYEAPRLEDGVVVPGHVVPAEP